MGLFGGTALAADTSSVDADGMVTIKLGEAFEIVFPDRNDLSHPKFSRVLDRIDSNVTGYRPVDPNAPPPTEPAVMSFELKDAGGMIMLTIRNDTGLLIKYDATMVVSGGREAHTSMCPMFPGMLGNEQWMDHIVALKISGFRKLDTTGGFVCD